ncbi:MAG: cytochrome c oxidase assembly protein, partial [Angustibacter sp.]
DPPTGRGTSDAAVELTGYPMPTELTALSWLTTWRVDVLWTIISVALVLAYVRGYVVLRRRGAKWPLARLLSFVAAALVLIWATSGAPGIYGRVLFSAHMVGHMTVTMVVPPLLVLGAPVTLFLRTWPLRRDGSWGLREWLLEVVHSRALRWVSHPLIAAGMFAGSLVVFYFTDLFKLSLTTHTGHVLMYAHFLLTGYLFASVLIGVDPGPARPAYPLRLVLLFATMAFHAFFGVAIVSGSELLAADYFTGLTRTWGDSPILDQQFGGAVAWALGEIPVLLLAMGIALAWVRSDDRQARREDRQADRDGDAQLTAYNDRLAALSRRSRGADQ